jgi:P4 family phage/plasmid primase-like protien
MHPSTREEYRWVDSKTRDLIEDVPDTDDLPLLPDTWVQRLTVCGPVTPSAAKASEDEVDIFIDEHNGESDPLIAEEIVESLEVAHANGRGRHDTLVSVACWAFRESLAGHIAAATAYEVLFDWWSDVMDDPDRLNGSEFEDAIAWAIAQVSIQEIQLNPGPVAPPSASDKSEIVVIPQRFNDATVSDNLAQELRGKFRWSALRGWWHWDGRHWKFDENESVYEHTRKYVLRLERAVLADPEMAERHAKSVRSYLQGGRIKNIVEMAGRQLGIATQIGDFDAYPYYLNAQNGVIDLRNGNLIEHDPDLLLTCIANADYDPELTHPDVSKLLSGLDPEVADWLQVVFGYASSGEISEDLVPFLDGAGANGKSTLIGAVAAALGDYAHPSSTRLILSSAHNEHPTMFATLKGKRFVYIEELPEDGALNDERIKSLSGGSEIVARFVNKDEFKFRPTHMLVVATNFRPTVNKSDHAIWRRLRLVPFTKTFSATAEESGDEGIIDPGLRSRLAKGNEQRSAMLTWIIEGARKWYRDGIPHSAVIAKATEEWREDEDVIQRFAADRLEFDAGESISSGILYDQYRAWCGGEGRIPLNNRVFKNRFENHSLFRENGIQRSRPGGVVTYKGVGLS